MTAAEDGRPQQPSKPLVVITGAGGNVGRSISAALRDRYRIVGIQRRRADLGFPVLEADFSSDRDVQAALDELRHAHGSRIASVIHLVAFFDFTGEDNPLYRSVNVEGTRRLLRGCNLSTWSSSCTRARCSCTRRARPASGSTRAGPSLPRGPIRNRKPRRKP